VKVSDKIYLKITYFDPIPGFHKYFCKGSYSMIRYSWAMGSLLQQITEFCITRGTTNNMHMMHAEKETGWEDLC
jgi:hypothetical protein